MRRAAGARATWRLLCVGSGDSVAMPQNRMATPWVSGPRKKGPELHITLQDGEAKMRPRRRAPRRDLIDRTLHFRKSRPLSCQAVQQNGRAVDQD